jgi:hypothetical protein
MVGKIITGVFSSKTKENLFGWGLEQEEEEDDGAV